MADGFVEHEGAQGLEPTKDGVKQFFRMYRASFPDLRMDVEEVLPSGDKVVGRATGTHTGEGFMGLPASGESVDVQLTDITRFDDDGLGSGRLPRQRQEMSRRSSGTVATEGGGR